MQPDYPAAVAMPAHPSRVHAAERTIRRVVIHVSDGHASAENLASMWATPGTTCAHFAVGQDGEVIQAAPVSALVWHAHRASHDSIGVEHCARSPGELGKGDAGLPLSEAQIEASAQLVAWACRTYGIPVDAEHVIGHKAADDETDHDDCPDGVTAPDGSKGWPWASYLARVSEIVAGACA